MANFKGNKLPFKGLVSLFYLRENNVLLIKSSSKSLIVIGVGAWWSKRSKGVLASKWVVLPKSLITKELKVL
jgi:hypothetical protein